MNKLLLDKCNCLVDENLLKHEFLGGKITNELVVKRTTKALAWWHSVRGWAPGALGLVSGLPLALGLMHVRPQSPLCLEVAHCGILQS